MAEVSSSVAIGYFIIIFLIYGYYKYSHDGEVSPGVTMITFLILVIGQGFLNLGISSSICQGAAQPTSAIIATILPWALVLGILNAVLAILPGWLIPFENTFGYIFVSIFTDLKDVFNDILVPRYNIENPEIQKGGSINPLKDLENRQKRDLGQALEQIYTDQSIILNELNNDNLDDFWKGFTESKLIKPNKDENKEKIRKFILLKSIVGEFMWCFFAGLLAVSISYNYLINIGCTFTAEQQLARQQALDEARKDANAASSDNSGTFVIGGKK